MSSKKYFGTDGVRGHVGGEFMNPLILKKLGWAIGSVLVSESADKPLVLIGRDTRESGELLQSALQEGLWLAGVNIALLGILSTPAIAYFTKKLSAHAGIVISASHNPYEDNGVKMIGQNGLKLSDEWEFNVEKKMSDALPDNFFEKKMTVIKDPTTDYIAHCVTLFSEPLDLKNYKLIIDCANGATFNTAPIVFKELSAHVTAIHATPNGKNINDQCGATDLSSLISYVLKEKADCGIALDGDGDRLMMVDHLGEVVDGDEILAILALYDRKYPAIVGTLMSNLGLEKAIKSHGMQFERVAVGDRYVLAKLQEKNWTLGGEGSGHIVNLKYSTTGDGVVTAMQVLRIMQQTHQSLHELKKIMQKRPQILMNVSVQNPYLFYTLPEISEAVSAAEKKLGDSGRVLLRASGTESCVRVMVEGDDATEVRAIAESLVEVVTLGFLKCVSH